MLWMYFEKSAACTVQQNLDNKEVAQGIDSACEEQLELHSVLIAF